MHFKIQKKFGKQEQHPEIHGANKNQLKLLPDGVTGLTSPNQSKYCTISTYHYRICLRIYLFVLITLNKELLLPKNASRSETIAPRHLQYVWLTDHCCMSHVVTEVCLVTNNNNNRKIVVSCFTNSVIGGVTLVFIRNWGSPKVLRVLSWDVLQVVSTRTVLDPHATV